MCVRVTIVHMCVLVLTLGAPPLTQQRPLAVHGRVKLAALLPTMAYYILKQMYQYTQATQMSKDSA